MIMPEKAIDVLIQKGKEILKESPSGTFTNPKDNTLKSTFEFFILSALYKRHINRNNDYIFFKALKWHSVYVDKNIYILSRYHWDKGYPELRGTRAITLHDDYIPISCYLPRVAKNFYCHVKKFGNSFYDNNIKGIKKYFTRNYWSYFQQPFQTLIYNFQAGVKPSLIQKLHLYLTVWFTCRHKRQDTSSKLLLFSIWFLLKDTMKKTFNMYENKMIKMYGEKWIYYLFLIYYGKKYDDIYRVISSTKYGNYTLYNIYTGDIIRSNLHNPLIDGGEMSLLSDIAKELSNILYYRKRVKERLRNK